jgi:hypothetical protein
LVHDCHIYIYIYIYKLCKCEFLWSLSNCSTVNDDTHIITNSLASRSAESIVYLAHTIDKYTDCSMWWPATQCSLLFWTAKSCDSYILDECVAVNTGLLLTMLEEDAENGFFWLAVTPNRHFWLQSEVLLVK